MKGKMLQWEGRNTLNTFSYHESAFLDSMDIGRGTKIWHNVHIREGATVGEDCIIGKGVYIDSGVIVGDRCKIQNYACLYKGVIIGDDVFIGPHCCFTNDQNPRAFGEFEAKRTVVNNGASIGANSTIRCGVTIGEYAMVGAGAMVTKNVPDYTLVFGVPAKQVGRVNKQGEVTYVDQS
jgi:UDP-2-acetamido-3-amino-2,3-dideoxy-glucuronate N-acetyltransferase